MGQKPATQLAHSAVTQSAVRRVVRFVGGSRRTLLSAKTANELVDPVNAVLAMRGVGGVRVTWADAGPVIALDKDTIPDDWPGGGDGSGTLNWKGVWSAITAYVVGDVVIRQTALNMEEADAGTFVCVQEHTGQEPPSGETMTSAYWETFARGHWIRLVADDGNGKLDALGGRITIEMDAEDPPTTIDLGRVNAIPAALVGKVFKPQVWDICVDGVLKKIGVITTDPWEEEE